MSGFFRFILLFLTGGVIYASMEILFRGFTHWSMAVTGGLCLCTIYLADKAMPHKGLLFKCLCGSIIITAYEFIVGVIVNLVLGWNVWDYSGMPLNLLGQVCPLFSGIWFLLTVPALWLCAFFRRYVFAPHTEKKKV